MKKFPFKKKILFSVVSAGLTCTLSDTVLANNDDHPMANKWYAGIQALYLLPSEQNMEFFRGYDVLDKESIHYDWGFEANIGYIFNDNDDIRLTYTRLHTGRDKQFLDTISEYNPDDPENSIDSIVGVSSEASFHYDKVNLDLGHLVSTGRWALHPFAGLEFLKINRKASEIVETQGSSSEDRTYSGIGPRIGTEASYAIGYNFSLVGSAAAALLMTEVKADFDHGRRKTSHHLISWAGETKIGLAYNTLLRDHPVSIEGGYKLYASDGGEGGSSTRAFSFGLGGPYLGVKVAF